jgi:hypothetical protein
MGQRNRKTAQRMMRRANKQTLLAQKILARSQEAVTLANPEMRSILSHAEMAHQRADQAETQVEDLKEFCHILAQLVTSLNQNGKRTLTQAESQFVSEILAGNYGFDEPIPVITLGQAA